MIENKKSSLVELDKTKINWPYSTAYVPSFIENSGNVLIKKQGNVKLDSKISLIGSDFDKDIDFEQLDIIDKMKMLTKSNMKRGDFKIAAVRILITYEGVKLNKINLLNHINNIMKCETMVDYIISHERCESTNEYHTHMYIKFDDIFQTINRKIFNFLNIQPNIDRVLHCDTDIYLVHQYLFQRDIKPCTNLSAERIQRIKYNFVKQLNTQSDLFNIPNKAKDEISISDDISKLILSYFPDPENSFDYISKNAKSESNKLLNNSPIKDLSVESHTDFDSNTNPKYSKYSKYSKCENIIDTIKILTNSKLKRDIFKFSTLRMILTYQEVKIDKINLLEYISAVLREKERQVKEYLIVYEKCEGKNMFHTHMYVKFNELFRTTNSRLFNYSEIQPNIERILHYDVNIKKVLTYLFERDLEPYTNLNIMIPRITHITNDVEHNIKAENTLKWNNTINNITLEENNKVEPIREWDFKPWQRFLLNVVSGKVDKRIFYWCWEPLGSMGKTELTHYIESNYKHVLVIETLDNLICTYVSFIKTQLVEIVIFDLPRRLNKILLNNDNDDLFKLIEMLKNDCINFNTERIKTKPCHVIVFSNCITGIKELSPSKWKIIKILEDGEACMGNVSKEGEIEYNNVHIVV